MKIPIETKLPTTVLWAYSFFIENLTSYPNMSALKNMVLNNFKNNIRL